MHSKSDGHVEILKASVRSLDHFLYASKPGSYIITAPHNIFREWGERTMPMPRDDYVYISDKLKPISYKNIDLTKDWKE